MESKCAGIKRTPKCAYQNDHTSHMATLEQSHFQPAKQIACKWCGSKEIWKIGVRNGTQNYRCEKCGRTFIDKDAPFHMWTPSDQIGASLALYYDGLSLADISRQSELIYKNPVDPSTAYRWLIRYTSKAISLLTPLKPLVGNNWVVDETVVKVDGRNVWYWDILDVDTRFLLATHLSKTRTILDVSTVMHRAWHRSGTAPDTIISDCLGVYPDGIERVFGAEAEHIQSKGFSEEINNNIIERFHGTIKERYKVMRGFKTPESAKLILDGFCLNYNFFRPHMYLEGKTPSEAARIKTQIKTWVDIVKVEL